MTVRSNNLDGVIYLSRRDIPWYQRAWVWGSAAIMILCCGLLAGWLLKPEVRALERWLPEVSEQPATPGGMSSQLVRLQAVSQQLREQITRLEMALSGDICNSGGLDAGPVTVPRKPE